MSEDFKGSTLSNERLWFQSNNLNFDLSLLWPMDLTVSYPHFHYKAGRGTEGCEDDYKLVISG